MVSRTFFRTLAIFAALLVLFTFAYAGIFAPQYLRGVYFARIVGFWSVTALAAATLFGVLHALARASAKSDRQ